DGSGQPSGLSASSIPISARILAVADEYVSELERGTPQTAMSVVSLRAGSLFDPAVVSTLASSLELGFEV
ncbi:MAG TPA: HD domain-containing phosphohydrolase, partial [Candidatus Fermentibacter sp.]|nr:HD domain-containing phosphohydrolase [Candidatus Fermentibacter sp.]